MILFDAALAVMLVFCELTFYHPSLAGGVMRSGQVYDPQDASVVAVGVDADGEPLIPMGTKITICRADMARCADGVVQDTGYLGDNLDGSPALFSKLDDLRQGRIDVVWYER